MITVLIVRHGLVLHALLQKKGAQLPAVSSCRQEEVVIPREFTRYILYGHNSQPKKLFPFYQSLSNSISCCQFSIQISRVQGVQDKGEESLHFSVGRKTYGNMKVGLFIGCKIIK
jgi:hypothetical protein